MKTSNHVLMRLYEVRYVTRSVFISGKLCLPLLQFKVTVSYIRIIYLGNIYK